MKSFKILMRDLKILENTVRTKSVDSETARNLLSYNSDSVMASEPYLTCSQATIAFELMDKIKEVATENYGPLAPVEIDESLIMGTKSEPIATINMWEVN